ncbi:MAG TPA: DUF3343 domain-containing protein [Candidatus Atribacteria bacterium]|nr:DUF3343 domain-containing protein [Candidatus Atribacteria bacterium]
MPYNETFDIVAFRSRQHAIHFNQVLQEAGINAHIISTPREVALGCGISLKFSPYVTNKVISLYKAYNPPIIGFYHVTRTGGSTIIARIPV